MNEETDRRDRERKLVKMTSEEFATDFNKAYAQAGQAQANRTGAFLVFVLVVVIAFAIYRAFAG